MAKAIALTYTVAKDYTNKITGTILLLCAFFAILYGINIFKTITRTVSIQRAQTEITALSSQVSALDSQYLKLSASVTPNILASYDLSHGHISHFISMSPTVDHFALTGHEF